MYRLNLCCYHSHRIRGGMGGHGGLGNTGDGGGGGFYGFGAGLGGGGDGGGDSESLMSELNRTKMALEKERFKGDQLMHYYLPRQMVDDYRSGRVVDPSKGVCTSHSPTVTKQY